MEQQGIEYCNFINLEISTTIKILVMMVPRMDAGYAVELENRA